MNATGKFLIVLTVFLLVLAAFAVYEGIARSAHEMVPESSAGAYRWRGWIEPFFDLLPVAVVSACIVAFSIAITAYDLGGSGVLLSKARPALLVNIILGSINTFWVAYLQPQIDLSLEEINNRGRFLEQLAVDAEMYIATGRLVLAHDRVSIYRAVLGENADGDNTLRTLEEQLQIREREYGGDAIGVSERTAEERDRVSDVDPTGQDARDLLARAGAAFEEGDYFSAHYFASQVIELDRPDFARRARELQANAMNAITDLSREIDEADERDLFRRKLTAYETLQRGKRGSPESVIEAHYLFEELYRIAPNDPDVERYRAETAVALADVAFFVEEAEIHVRLPAVYELFFLNRNEADVLEFFWAARIVHAREGTWLYDVEILRISGLLEDSPQIVHYGADYAKLIDGRVVLRAIRREGVPGDEANRIHPVYYRGESRSAIDEMIDLTLPLSDLTRFAGGVERAVDLPLPALLQARSQFEAIGRDPRLIWEEISNRTLRIFGFFIVSFWALAIAWRYRSMYLGRAPLLVYAVIPVVPLVVRHVILLSRRIASHVVGGLLRVVEPVPIVVIILCVVSIVALIGAFFSLARQSIRP